MTTLPAVIGFAPERQEEDADVGRHRRADEAARSCVLNDGRLPGTHVATPLLAPYRIPPDWPAVRGGGNRALTTPLCSSVVKRPVPAAAPEAGCLSAGTFRHSVGGSRAAGSSIAGAARKPGTSLAM